MRAMEAGMYDYGIQTNLRIIGFGDLLGSDFWNRQAGCLT
jgi:hypothetical protein